MESLEAHKGKTYDYLDHGFVRLVDWMGSDQEVEEAARLSYGGKPRDPKDTRHLIRYLMRQYHTTPTEMAVVKFQIKMPIFVMRQHVRHRTASMNEYSGRYSKMVDEFYLPAANYLVPQSKTNKQGGGLLPINPPMAEIILSLLEAHQQSSYDLYNLLLGEKNSAGNTLVDLYPSREDPANPFKGISKELARSPLPVSNYTECYWKMDLHNLFNYLRLRTDSHAQQEIQDLANHLYNLIKPLFPMSCEAFDDYIRLSKKLSRMEFNIVTKFLSDGAFAEENKTVFGMGDREWVEFKTKFGR